ncbi:hypothetical protein D6745_00405 [Candidatus Woesearchaeota archaeon]|nr:MAG: hypothetical protein D6745_00405 [Candidatus Woesearchaeota archaeon]
MENIKSELGRKAVHIIGGIIIITLFYVGALPRIIIYLMLLASLFASMYAKSRSSWLDWLLEKFERPEVRKNFPFKGLIFFLSGIVLSMFVFEKSIALAAICVLVFGDSTSHISALFFKKTNTLKKSVEASAVGAAVSFLAAMLFTEPLLAFVGAVAGMAVEAIEIRISETTVDDNLLVPLAAGSVMTLTKFFITFI